MQLNFDATNHVPTSFDPLPSAWYDVMMVEGKETPVKNKADCTYYAAIFEVISGKFKGRKLFHNFNFKNDNPKAVEIAYDQLGTICHAVGVLKPQVMDQLFNKPMQAKVKLKPAVMEEDGVTEKYEAGNEIKGFKAIETGTGSAGGGLPEGFGDNAAQGGGLPEGFTAGAVVEQAKPEAAAASIPSAASATAPKEEAAPVKKLVMTDKANGGTAEQFRAHDPAWTDDLLVKEGYARWEEVKPSVPSTPSTPSTPSAPATSAPATEAAGSTTTQTSAPADAAEDDDTPPWLQQG